MLWPIAAIESGIFTYDIFETNEDIMFISNTWNSQKNTLLKSTDAGKTWIDISSNLIIDSPHRFRPEMYRIMKNILLAK